MGSFNEVIDAMRTAPTNVDRGTLFEQLMVRYFQLDPVLAQQYDEVCRWIDWPGRDGKPDTGIDLVARERDTGEYTAVQCKFYEPTTTLSKGDIDTFFTASGKKPFTNRVIISTTDKWGKNAEDALADQHIQVQRIGMADIAESPIDWDIAWPQGGGLSIELSPAVKNQPRPHQVKAIEAVLKGFAIGNDRGKLIMACGTGKTYTALKLAEAVAVENGGSARILFLVPSISLLSQSLREWTAQSELDMRAFGVCSDTKVGKLRNTIEDFSVHDVPVPVTTDPTKLLAEMEHRKRAKGLTVVFSTYQSLPAVADAQALGLDDFDLVICDEAHRTTGVTLAGEDESNFVRIHDNDYLRANRRLYMTATPRIYGDAVKEKADAHSAELVSMDDELRYGPEFHHLSFGDAVERGLLTDYKVLVLTVDESVIAAPLQQQIAAFGEIPNLDDASKIVGCWNGLAKRGNDFPPGEAPMQRAVAFARDIKTSKAIAELFPKVVSAYQQALSDREVTGNEINETNRDLTCDVHHVDGTFNALKRNGELAWLKAPVDEGECRILTNARCLSEGVDVPALDAVLFMHPRNSVVDVVQSVGRVMRLSPKKEYGYVILPVAVPAGTDPATALADNVRFKVVWQVLNALRSHDERFDAMINSIALNAGSVQDLQLMTDHVGPTREGDESVVSDQKAAQLALFSLEQWQEAVYTRIVDKVGTRVYWDQWATDVADIATAQITRINAILESSDTDKKVVKQFDKFWKGLRDNLNDAISRDDAISMLSQHLITKPIFDALFAEHDFAAHNPVSQVMQAMADVLDGNGLEAETRRLEKFYDSVRLRAEQVTDAQGKQHLIADLYQKFFQTAFKKQSDSLGIVYTPVEVVDFILRAADHASREHLGRGLTDKGVHILDGFTGTGTFITRLLESDLITPKDLARKYNTEVHANEIMLLAYYIAAVNIETTYHAVAGKTAAEDCYEPFPGIVLADTFQVSEQDDTLDLEIFAANNDRIQAQLDTDISIIIGNPPYSVGQTSANDLNANTKYPTLDQRIQSTFVQRSNARVQHTLYDSYIRAFRWATDRIGDAGVVAFVANGGWIDSNTADGIRLSMADECSHIYIYNLRGNGRVAGERGRKEGRPIFEFGGWRSDGSEIKSAKGGSRATIAIALLVKEPSKVGPARIHYAEVADYLSAGEKIRAIVDAGSFRGLSMREIIPNEQGDWASQRNDDFVDWPVVGDKTTEPGVPKVFGLLSGGVASGRDAWNYNYSRRQLDKNIHHLLRNYDSALERFEHYRGSHRLTRVTPRDVEEFLRANRDLADPSHIKWSISLQTRFARGTRIHYKDDSVRLASYRPFSKQFVYAEAKLNHSLYKLMSIFPTQHHDNVGLLVLAPRDSAEFGVLAVDAIPDLSFFTYTAQFLPRWTYEKAENDGTLDFGSGTHVDEWGYRRIDNITDEILTLYHETVGDQVDKNDIFHYVYGILHDPGYRTQYAADLKKLLPHIPTPDTPDRFREVADIGRRLVDLHLGYDEAEPYPLDVQLRPGVSESNRDTWRVDKMKWKSKTDRSAIIYNNAVTIAGIPEAAHEYMVGSRTALEWLIDRYMVKTDKASGIVNDPNDWCDEHDDPTYIVDLIKRVTTVSVRTVELVSQLGG
jgi:predicted helicase